MLHGTLLGLFLSVCFVHGDAADNHAALQAAVEASQAPADTQLNDIVRRSSQAALMSSRVSPAQPGPVATVADEQNYRVLIDEVLSAISDTARQASSDYAARRFGMADGNMALLRHKTLAALGLNRGVQGYLFVSHSMPEGLIRSYALDAETFGLSLVFKGPDRGEKDVLASARRLGALFHTRNPAMSVQIDPRAFDAFDITSVPALVLSKRLSSDLCQSTYPSAFEYKGQTLFNRRCTPQPRHSYCKISGSITVDWAIRTMSKKGCDLARHLEQHAKKHPARVATGVAASYWQAMQKTFIDKSQTSRYEKVLLNTLREGGDLVR